MVAGHVQFGGYFYKFIHAFHMPMFYFVSGLFFRDKVLSVETWIKQKGKSLLVPYFAFGILSYIINAILGIDQSEYPFVNLFWCNTNGIPVSGALWFLTSLLFTELIYFFMNTKFRGNNALITICCACIAVLGLFEKHIFPFSLPWGLGASFVGIGFYHFAKSIGSKIKLCTSVFLNQNVLMCLLTGFIISFSIFVNRTVNMRTGDYGNVVLFWINALTAIMVGLNLCRIILDSPLNACFYTRWIIRWIEYIGKYSITFVCLNGLVILVLKKFFVFDECMVFSKATVFLLSLICLSLMNHVILNSKLKVLIGR